MLAGLERSKRHRGMVGDRRIDVDGVDLAVLEEVGVVLVPPLDAIGLADLIELVPRPLADRDELRVGVALVDGDELGAKAEADDGGANGPGRAGGGGHTGGSSMQGVPERPSYFTPSIRSP